MGSDKCLVHSLATNKCKDLMNTFDSILGNRVKNALRLRRQVVKEGRCPSWSIIRNCSSLEQCNWDGDCSGTQKCCKSTCETRSCYEPILAIGPGEGTFSNNIITLTSTMKLPFFKLLQPGFWPCRLLGVCEDCRLSIASQPALREINSESAHIDRKSVNRPESAFLHGSEQTRRTRSSRWDKIVVMTITIVPSISHKQC